MPLERSNAGIHQPPRRPDWRDLPRGALGFRIAHVVWGIVELAALAHVWASALRRRRDRYAWASAGLLLLQGAALIAGRGNCPFGPVQRQLGDPVPMFELALPPRAAKAAIPILAVVAVTGIGAMLVRPLRGCPAPRSVRLRWPRVALVEHLPVHAGAPSGPP